MEIIKKDSVENVPIHFNLSDSVIASLAEKYSGMEIKDPKSYRAVVSGIREIRTLRVKVEKRRKELKADALAWGRRVDAEAHRLTDLLLPIENNLKSLKKAEDDRKAAIKAEKERVEKERVQNIRSKIEAFPPSADILPQLLKMKASDIQSLADELSGISITPEEFQEFTPEALKAKEEKRALLQEYYIARIQADAEEKKRLEKEKEQEAKRKAEEERLAKILKEQKAEAERIKAEQEKIEAEKQALREKQERLEHERLAKIEAEKQALIQAEQAKQVELERAAEKKRQAALKPDRENLLTYLEAIAIEFERIYIPSLKTNEGKALLFAFTESIKKAIRSAKNQAENLGTC